MAVIDEVHTATFIKLVYQSFVFPNRTRLPLIYNLFWVPYFYVYIWSYPPETYTLTNTYSCPDSCNTDRCCSNYGRSLSFGLLSLGNYFRNYNWGIWSNLNMITEFLGYIEYDCMSKVKPRRKLAKEFYPPHLDYIRQTCD